MIDIDARARVCVCGVSVYIAHLSLLESLRYDWREVDSQSVAS